MEENIKPSDMDKLFKKIEVDRFENNAKVIPIESASFKRLIKHLNSGVPIMVISACREENTVAENNKNTKILIKDIIDNGLSFVPVNGFWTEDANIEPKPEKSFFVVGKIRGTNVDVDYDEFFNLAVELCNKYNQSAVLVGKANKDKIEYNYVDKDGIFTNEKAFTKIKEITNEDIKDLIKENGYAGYTQFKKKKKGKFMLESVMSSRIDEEHLKHSKATMFANRMIYQTTKNYGLYYLDMDGDRY